MTAEMPVAVEDYRSHEANASCHMVSGRVTMANIDIPLVIAKDMTPKVDRPSWTYQNERQERECSHFNKRPGARIH